ncbi:MAG: sulfite exporter TauE/SafE family protein [Actinomycetota bacterium]|nr:sulfite exporter TauE/SafE family protein [Actinomycetota bacterium]
MSPVAGVVVVAAGMAAGTINTIVGSGSLITFPTLLALGYSPVVANVSNTVGLLPGSVSGAIGYRRELHGQRERVVALSTASVAGGLTGAVLLLLLPSSVFRGLLPVLILGACVLVALQPRLALRAAAGSSRRGAHGGPPLLLGVYATGVYGGYFGAAYGVITLALLGIFVDDSLQRLNGAKNVLGGLVNGMAALVFATVADVAWDAAGLLAVGAVVGGQIGAGVGRRIPAAVLRAVIVTVGLVAAGALVA